jgi:ArsR family transcriptional regulator, arsenate/arsenite/antimonite-responsive transcriptional repressor / arsenate reductase (thioredoxin)
VYCRCVSTPTTVTDVSPLEFLQLVADPLRWQLLDELGRSDRRVGELCELVGKPQSLVSYHLRELRTAGLVSARQSAADGRDTYYQANIGRCAELLSVTGGALHPAVRLARLEVDAPPPGRGRKPRVLFLCTGNSARSQIAEVLLEHRSHGAFAARSAGSNPKPLHPNAVRVMAERGIDISRHRSKHLERFTGDRFDRVITLCDKVREVCPDFPGEPATAHWSMADPAAEGSDAESNYDAFVRTADEIELRVGLLIPQLSAEKQTERSRS